MEAIIFIALISVTWLFASGAGSIQFIKSLLILDNNAKITNAYWSLIRELVNCAMCMGFWIGFVYYLYNGYSHFFLFACLVSIGAELFSRMLNLVFDKWLNKF